MKRLFVLLTFVLSINVFSQPMDTSFSYQGELLDNGSPANDNYDFQVVLIDGLSQQVGSVSQHNAVEVSNGLFTLDVNFDIPLFDGFEDYYLEISVRKTSDGGFYTTLSPLQQLQSVPLASNLVNGNATVGDVLTFNGFQWNPAQPVNLSPWNENNNDINYPDGGVGIGVVTPFAKLHVKSTISLTSAFDGGQDMYVGFAENGINRGYVGSYTSSAGTNDEDFEVGTYSSNDTGNLQFTIQNDPVMTVHNSGNVGVGNTNPQAKMMIDADAGSDALRVRIDNSTKLFVDNDGGTAIGSLVTPPSNGLSVAGDSKQNSDSNGMLKYMLVAKCSDTDSQIDRSYNGTNTFGNISIINGDSVGKCSISFPTAINTRYWVSSANNGLAPRGVSCQTFGASDVLECLRFNPSDGAGANGRITILIY